MQFRRRVVGNPGMRKFVDGKCNHQGEYSGDEKGGSVSKHDEKDYNMPMV